MAVHTAGAVSASWDAAKFIEYTHRALVSGLLILLLMLTVIAWVKYRNWVEIKVLTVISIVFVFVEAALGALAVLMATPPLVTALHMGVALVAFCAVAVLTTVIGSIDKRNLRSTGEPLRPKRVTRAYSLWVWFGLVYVLFAIYFGSFVAASGAGAAFKGWPFPEEKVSQVHWMFWIDVMHRSIALGLVILLVALTVAAKKHQHRSDLFRTGIVLLILTCLQAVSGAMLIYTHLSIVAYPRPCDYGDLHLCCGVLYGSSGST